MFTTICHITLFIVFIISSVHADKFRYCSVDGRGNFKRTAKYCPILEKPGSKVQCIQGIDRLDCLRKISKKQVDFAVFTSEDLITATNSAIEALVTNELRFSEDKYEYQVVAVIDKKSAIKSRHDLQDKRFCHPGYGYEFEWTKTLSNYLESSVVPQTCQPELTLTENRIKSSSEFFNSACKAGPWVNNSTLDYELKRKYPNLCEACGNPQKCSKDDKYWGRRGSLFCLTDGAGEISWARWDDVKVHFGLLSENSEVSPDEYSLLCPDDTLKPVNTTKPCVWVVKPWSIVATERSKAQDIQQMISLLTHDDNDSWQSALLNLMESYHVSIKSLQPVEPIESYLTKATGFLSANSFSGCHPPRTIRMCTTSIAENAKCRWLREAMFSYSLEPNVECLKADNRTQCLDAVNRKFADMVIIEPDQLEEAQNTYNLKTIFYETVYDFSKYLTVAVTKKDNNLNSFDDLKGSRACFPSYGGVAWNTVAHILNEKNLLQTCPIDEGMANFFGQSCVPGIKPNQVTRSLMANCKNNSANGDVTAINCLIDDEGEVAFVSKNNLKEFLLDPVKNKRNLSMADLNIICKEPDTKRCILSWAPIGQAMIRKNSTDLWIKDTLDVFFAIDDLFGKYYRSLTTPFTLFGPFNGQNNLLFHDSTSKIKSQPKLKNIDQMPGEYGEILANIHCKLASGSSKINVSLFLFVSLYILRLISNEN